MYKDIFNKIIFWTIIVLSFIIPLTSYLLTKNSNVALIIQRIVMFIAVVSLVRLERSVK